MAGMGIALSHLQISPSWYPPLLCSQAPERRWRKGTEEQSLEMWWLSPWVQVCFRVTQLGQEKREQGWGSRWKWGFWARSLSLLGRWQEAGVCAVWSPAPGLSPRPRSIVASDSSYEAHKDTVMKNFKLVTTERWAPSAGAFLSTEPCRSVQVRAQESDLPGGTLLCCWRWTRKGGTGFSSKEMKTSETLARLGKTTWLDLWLQHPLISKLWQAISLALGAVHLHFLKWRHWEAENLCVRVCMFKVPRLKGGRGGSPVAQALCLPGFGFGGNRVGS